MGLLDEFIDPEKQAEKIEEKNKDQQNGAEVLPEMAARSSSPVTEESPSLTTTLTSPEILPYDDTDIHTEPSRHVDYFSHQWDVSDIYKSWRYVIQKRKDVANAARLENASWRTWAQRRSNLKTISPEVVNWSKDNDITWLYGPILKNEDHWDSDEDEENDKHHHKRETTATSKVAGDISIALAPKPILKRRTVQAKMMSHSNLLKWELLEKKLKQRQEHEEDLRIAAEEKAAEEAKLENEKRLNHRRTSSQDPPEFNDFDAISAKLNSQYRVSSDADLKTLPRQGSTNSLIAASLDKHRRGEVKTTPGNSGSESASISSFLMGDQEPAHVEDALMIPANTMMASVEEVGSSETVDVLPIHSPELVRTLSPSLSIASPMAKSSSLKMSALSSPVKKERHIHFNEEVQQCIAVDTYSDVDADNYYDDADVDDDYYYDDDEDEEEDYIYETAGAEGEGEEDEDDEDDEGGFFIDVRSSANAPGLTKNSASSPGHNVPPPGSNDVNTEDTESISTNNSKVYKTIHLLPSTQINYGSSEEESDDENPYTSSLSHNASNRGYDYYYDYNSVYTVDPNHAIYGAHSNSSKIVEPDVVDVPDNIAMGSNFDYEIIDAPPLEVIGGQTSGSNVMPIIDSSVIHGNNINYQAASSAISQPQDSVQLNTNSPPTETNATAKKENAFEFSDSDSDSDDGLSISTRRSSQALVEQVFNQGLTPSSATGNLDFSATLQQPQPHAAPINAEHILTINPRYSSDVAINKQPSSSSSLSELFFGTSSFTKKDPSRTSLADQFFGVGLTSSNDNNDNTKSEADESNVSVTNTGLLAKFFNSPPSPSSSPIPRTPAESAVHTKVPSGISIGSNSSGCMSAPLYESLTGANQSNPPQRKVSPLPPHTTSTNAFLGFLNSSQNRTEGNDDSAKKGAFLFDSDSSDDEFIEDVRSQPTLPSAVPVTSAASPKTHGGSSYSTLSYVADKNGIVHTPPEENPGSMNTSPSNIIGQAKGLANLLLGNWKSENH